MLEPLTDLPDGVIGFEAVGEIHATDYEETFRPALEAAARWGMIRLVYVLGERFDGFSTGASWEDAKLGFEHRRAWHRAALVSDIDWVNHLASLFAWMMPGDFKLFERAQLPQAITWAATDDGRT